VTSARVGPFPWGAIDAMSRAEVATQRALRGWSRTHARADDVARTIGSLIEAKVEVIVRRAGSARTTSLDAGVAVVLTPADGAKLDRCVVVEADGALAASLIAHAVRRPLAAILDSGRAHTPSVAGAFAAIVAATARRVHGGTPLRVLAAGPSAAIVSDVGRAAPDMLSLDLTVIVDDDAHLARVLLPRTAAIVATAAPWDADRLAALGDVVIALPIVACASTATATEIAQLAAGDAWLPGEWPLARSASGDWVGAVALAASSLDVGIVADLGEGGQLVLRGEMKQLGWTPEPRDGDDMDQSKQADALIEAVGEVPVVVRAEIGTAQMRARDWAALGKGDVVALGRRIADPIVLRVGGVEVARGELVELEGEVAVRIVERIDGKGTRS
jgi:flagellar motor switch/type III secretory pathway protein FliN